MTDQELVATYVTLLPIMWSGPNTPNAQATIDVLATTAIADQVVGQVLDGFALTDAYGQTVAVGAQLNLLGQFVGAPRSLANYFPIGSYFSFQDTSGAYDPSAGGFGDVRDAAPPADYWISTTQITDTYVLSDDEMVQLIRYLAAVNHAEFTVGKVKEILFRFFGSYVTVAETDSMEITYTQAVDDPGTLFGIVDYLKAFPHPAGVEIIVVPG